MIMKRRIKTTFCLLAAAICFLFPLKGQAADSYEWVMDSVNARIQYVNTTTGEPLKSQFKKIKGYIYYFDKNGYAATGFTKIDGFYYYFDSTGAMLRPLLPLQWTDGCQPVCEECNRLYLRWKRRHASGELFQVTASQIH